MKRCGLIAACLLGAASYSQARVEPNEFTMLRSVARILKENPPSADNLLGLAKASQKVRDSVKSGSLPFGVPSDLLIADSWAQIWKVREGVDPLDAFEGCFAAEGQAKESARTLVKTLSPDLPAMEIDKAAAFFLKRLAAMSDADRQLLRDFGKLARSRRKAQALQTAEAKDVELILGWLRGDKGVTAFARDFGDSKFLTDAKDALLYTDVSAVSCPKGLKLVPYDFVRARMDRIHRGDKASPAVLVTRSVRDDPDEDRPRRGKSAMKNERFYYVEVAIGNRAWHRLKIVIGEVDGKQRAVIAWWEAS